ncbi:MAG: hypothetical protein WC838_05600 [Candidatus Margulisiibacteriota bacterium]|jgi:hypothetical protein
MQKKIIADSDHLILYPDVNKILTFEEGHELARVAELTGFSVDMLRRIFEVCGHQMPKFKKKMPMPAELIPLGRYKYLLVGDKIHQAHLAYLDPNKKMKQNRFLAKYGITGSSNPPKTTSLKEMFTESFTEFKGLQTIVREKGCNSVCVPIGNITNKLIDKKREEVIPLLEIQLENGNITWQTGLLFDTYGLVMENAVDHMPEINSNN